MVRFRLDMALARRQSGRLDDKLLSGDIVFMNDDTASALRSTDEPSERWQLEWRPTGAGWLRQDELSEELRPESVVLDAADLEFLPHQTTVVALHDFEPVRPGRDLGLKFGDRVVAIDHGDKPWWLGYLESDEKKQLGEFPSNYCQAAIVPPIRSEADEWSVSKREKMRREEHFSAHGGRADDEQDSRQQGEDLPPKLRRNEVGHGSKIVFLEVASGLVAMRALRPTNTVCSNSSSSSWSTERSLFD